MLKWITLLIVALVMVSMIASAPLNAAVFRVYVGSGAFVRPAHPYWYSYPAPYYAPYPGYPYVYYDRAPGYPYYGYTYSYHWGHHRHHEWRHHYRR